MAAIAITKGPGSYTGLRIGTATAKGLCFTLQKPLIAVNTLEAMTHEVSSFFISQSYYFCPMIDARRMEVYCGVYNEQLQTILPIEAKVIDENSFADVLVNQKVVFFGDGSDKCKVKLSHQSNAFFIRGIRPSAQQVGELAWLSFQKTIFEDIETFEPFYLKEFISSKEVLNNANQGLKKTK